MPIDPRNIGIVTPDGIDPNNVGVVTATPEEVAAAQQPRSPSRSLGVLRELARAYLAMEARKLGIPQAEQAAQTAESENALRRAQAQEILGKMRTPEEAAAALEHLRAQTELYRGQETRERANASKALTPKQGTPHYATDSKGNVTAITQGENGTYNTTPIGPVGTAQKPGAPKAPHLIAGTDLTTGKARFGVAGEEGFGPPQTTVERTRQDQAGHVISQAASFLAEMKNPEVRGLFGGLHGYGTEMRQKSGLLRAIAPNPAAASHVKSALASLSAFLPIMHGMRGGENMIAHFEGVLGDFTSSPEQIEQATLAIGEAAKRIREQGDAADLTDLVPSAAGAGTGPPAPAAGGGFRVVGVRPK